jgi:hypothetical protein
MDSLVHQLTKVPIKDSLRIAKSAIESVKFNVVVPEAPKDWTGDAISFIGSLLGAAVAVWAAVWTLRRSNRIQADNEKRKSEELRHDKIRYFGMLTNSATQAAISTRSVNCTRIGWTDSSFHRQESICRFM